MEPADAAPFLVNSPPEDDRQIHRSRTRLRGAARFLRRGRLREPSMRVRESAAEQLEERRSEWAYSKPIVILDVFWNLVFVIVSLVFLILSLDELPRLPLRWWILGYVVQCVLHVVCVCVEYRRRAYERSLMMLGQNEVSGNSSSSLESEDGEFGDYGLEQQQQEHQDDDRTSTAKHLESANTMFSFIWWIIGFYWVTAGADSLAHESPRLYWLCITFLALDVFFVVICVAAACVVGIAVCCCLPCIIAILYAVTDQEGATEEDLERLPKYKFRSIADLNKLDGEVQVSFGGIMTECSTERPTEHSLSPEDAECCICISPYEDGTELRELPCHHHFHCICIDKWLRINAICPLCKFNILKNGD